jgi:hypothetical protein
MATKDSTISNTEAAGVILCKMKYVFHKHFTDCMFIGPLTSCLLIGCKSGIFMVCEKVSVI